MTGRQAAARWRARGEAGRRLLVFATIVLLAGCVTPRPTTPGPTVDWPDERSRLQALQRFSLHGRVAVSTGPDGFNGSLEWVQDHARTSIEIDGPLGSGGLRVETDGGTSLALTTSRGERLDGDVARAELERRLGFALPLASLRFWIVGAPDPALPVDEQTLGTAQRLQSLEQAGWRIDYPLYAAVDGDLRPKRVTLEREAARVRLIVDRWDR